MLFDPPWTDAGKPPAQLSWMDGRGTFCGGKNADRVFERKMTGLAQTEIVFTSPMQRCRESAQILFPDREKIEIPEWKEMNFGAFEGKNYG